VNSRLSRRQFAAAAAAALSSSAFAAQPKLPIQKAVLLSMIPKELSLKERFQLAADCGFTAVEAHTMSDPAMVAETKAAAAAAKITIHSVMNSDHWKFPLSSADPATVDKCLEGMRTSLRNAKEWGATTVLLVPAVVDAKTSYEQAWKRSTEGIKKLLPLAQELKVTIAVENVWNKFLLSPLEFNNYVDSFKSPYLKAYFDVGNIVLYGYPHDWIRALGPRIAKLHLKDFRFQKRQAEFVALRDGDIDWPEIYRALSDIKYQGYATVELNAGDGDYLKEVSRRVDLILTGEPKRA
jgi:L-ribulose-5-phosphate 3-epimerase